MKIDKHRPSTFLVITLGNMSWFMIGIIFFMLCAKFGLTPLGKFMKYNASMVSEGIDAKDIIADPQWQRLLERFQLFLGIIVEPILSFTIAFFCTLFQRQKSLLITYLAVLPLPLFLVMSYYYSNLIDINIISFDLSSFMPVLSLLMNVVLIYFAYIIAGKIIEKKEISDY